MFLRTDSTTLKCTMNSWTKIVLIFCTLCTCYSKTFRVAWLAPGQNSGQKINSYTSVAGLKLALASVMSNTMILNGHTIEVEYFPTDCTSQASTQAVAKAKHFNPDVIIGPPCQEGMKMVAQMCANWNLPVFTWYNPGIEFDSTLTYPTLVRMVPSLNAMSLSLLHLFRQNKWKQFAFIYDDREPWSLYEEAVRVALADTNINMLSSHGVNNTVTDTKLWQLFSHIKKYSWIFVFACPASDIRRYMLIADQAGMGNGSYIFIQLDHQLYSEKVLNSAVLTSQRWMRGDAQDEAARQVYQSLIHVLLDPMNDDKVPTYTIPRNRYEEFSTMAAAEVNTQNSGWKLPVGGPPDVYSLYLYDAILVWSALVDRLDKAGKNYRDGKLLVKEAKQFFADGASGYFSLNQNVDRIAKMFILYMENDGSFKPSQILRFNSTDGYETINLKTLQEQTRRHGGQTGVELNQINAIGTPTMMSFISKSTTVSTRLLPTTKIETLAAMKTAPVKPSIPPPPPEHTLSGHELFPAIRTTDPLISRLLAKVESLEKTIKNHELHAHAHIPDHTHTPHPLLLGLSSTLAPTVKVPKEQNPVVDGHAHVSAYPTHHTPTPHTLALDNLLGHRNLGHAHFPHQHVHVPTQPTNHIHSANDTYRQQTTNARIPSFYDHAHHPHHWHPHPHYPGYNRGYISHAPDSHLHQFHVPTSHRPPLPTYKTTSTTTLAPQTTTSRKMASTSNEQFSGQIDEAMLNRISSKIVDQLTSTNATHSNNEERVVNDWFSGGIDDIGPGLLLAAKSLEQKRLLHIINQRLYEQSLQNNRQKSESTLSKNQAQTNPPTTSWSTPAFNNPFAPVTDPLASLWGASIIW